MIKDYKSAINNIQNEFKDYLIKSKLKSLVLGVSGGIDSALTAALAQPVCDELDIKSGSFPKVWPIVQAYDDPQIISAEEFEVVLRGGLASASTGVMMFTTRAMAQSEEKTQVMKKVYFELMH